ncbi:MAG: S8 family serine peptidase, partial [Chloroflexota bacterium]
FGLPGDARAATPADAARAYLSVNEGGAITDWQLAYERAASVAGSGETLWAGKLLNTRTGAVRTVYRAADGSVGGPEFLVSRGVGAVAALSALAVKADAPLRSAVAAADPEHDLPVAVWLDADVGPAEAAVIARHPDVTWIDGRPLVDDLATARLLRGELWEARRAAYAAVQAAFSGRVRAAGGTIGYASTSAPLVFIDLPAGRVAGIAADTAIDALGLEGSWSPAMSSAGPTIDANWTGGSGDLGNGVRVAVVEYHNVRGGGDLSGRVAASYSTSGTLAYTSSSTFDHPTWVAGAIAGHATSYPGVAPGAIIVSAGTGGYTPSLSYDRAVIHAADWAVSPTGGDADIVNTSLVQDTATGAEEARRYFDSLSFVDARLAVSAAGNYVNAGSWSVGSPGTGWNVLTVGGTDDRGTISRSDDRLWYVPGSNGANFADPPGTAWNAHGDFNKPNVSAPAVNVRTANGLAASGTSVATPMVSGIAAQLIARAPTLASWPEATRALVMAGAIRHIRMPDGSMNADHEGVGTVSALWPNRALVNGDGTYGGYQFGSVSDGQALSRGISVVAGQTVKVALAWNSHTSGSGTSMSGDTLTADLDLRVRQPDGTVVGSYTFDNAHESIEFTARVTGTAIVEVLQTRFDAASERYGLAWTKWGGDTTRPRITRQGPGPGAAFIPPAAPVTVTFDEAVLGVSGTSITLHPVAGGGPVAARVSYAATSRTATLVPNGPLAPGNYRVDATSGIHDAAGNAVTASSWTFSVAAARPPISMALPSGTSIRLAAGTHVGYRFDSDGTVTGSRASTYGATTHASIDARATLAGQPGRWLHVRNGMLIGLWVRESAAASVGGAFVESSYDPGRRFVVSAGTHTGRRFAEDGTVVDSRTRTISATSGASASRRATINGLPYLRVVDGVWAGTWLPESSTVRLPGLADLEAAGGSRARIAAGTTTGFRYAADGSALSARSATLAAPATVPIAAGAVINGRRMVYVTAGIWAGTWIAESSAVRVP